MMGSDHSMDPSFTPHMSVPPTMPPQGPGPMMPPGYNSSSMLQGMGGGGMNPGMYPSMGMRPQQRAPGPLSPVQMKLLSAQIKAYRFLARNLNLPEPIKTFIYTHASSVGPGSATSVLPGTSSSPAPPVSAHQSGGMSDNQRQPTLPPTTASLPSSPAVQPPQGAPRGTDPQKPPLGAAPPYPGPPAGSSQQTPPQSSSRPVTTSEGKSAGGGTPQAKPHQTQIKSVKLAPVQRPKGIDPESMLREREVR